MGPCQGPSVNASTVPWLYLSTPLSPPNHHNNNTCARSQRPFLKAPDEPRFFCECLRSRPVPTAASAAACLPPDSTNFSHQHTSASLRAALQHSTVSSPDAGSRPSTGIAAATALDRHRGTLRRPHSPHLGHQCSTRPPVLNHPTPGSPSLRLSGCAVLAQRQSEYALCTCRGFRGQSRLRKHRHRRDVARSA